MPSPEETKHGVAGIFDRGSATYDQTGADFFSTFGRWVVEAARLQPGERVLDIGSGRGAVLIPAAAAVAPRGSVDGIDLAPGMVTRLREDLVEVGNASVVLGDAEHPPVTGPYDAVLCGLVLFFLPAPAVALTAYRNLLVPAGRLVFSSFSEDDRRWDAVFRAAAAAIPPGEVPVERAATKAGPFSDDTSITDLLVATGFRDVAHQHRSHVTSFADQDDWWAWTWSHGARGMWEQIPCDRLEEVRALAYEAIESIRDNDGAITIRTTVRITTARS
jgi:ubiquinone/menaquinone biosynthesis C-methylase UbiE